MNKRGLLILSFVLVIFISGCEVNKIFKSPTEAKETENYTAETMPPKPEYVPGEILIKFKQIEENKAFDKVKEINSESSKLKDKKIKKVEKLIKKINKKDNFGLDRIYKIVVNEDEDVLGLIKEYEKNPNVEYAEPNYLIKLIKTTPIEDGDGGGSLNRIVPNDPFFNLQWTHRAIQSEYAWNIEQGNSNITIAILDTGVDYTHPDLVNNVWINEDEISNNGIDDDDNGYVDDYYGFGNITPEFYNGSNGPGPLDEDGHGTHIAGIAAATGDNNIGVTGICWNCKIMSVKITGLTGYNFSDEISKNEIAANAIVYATDNGANILSNSWITSELFGPIHVLEDAVNYAYYHNLIIVGGAPNDNHNYKAYPAAFNNVISVASTIDEQDHKAYFSNYGSWIDVASPGAYIYSTMPTYPVTLNTSSHKPLYYAYISGNSMATPLVAGLAGLIWSKNPSFSNEEVMNIIKTAVDPINSAYYIGTGRINAYKALKINTIPVARLNSNLDDVVINGSNFEITGTAEGNNFKNYTLEYCLGIYTEDCHVFWVSNYIVNNITLGYLDSFGLKEGAYTIKLIVTNIYNQESIDKAIVHVDNIGINSPKEGDVLRAGNLINITGYIGGFDNYSIDWIRLFKIGEDWSTEGVILNENCDYSEECLFGQWNTSIIDEPAYYRIRLRVNVNQNLITENLTIFLDPTLKEGWPRRFYTTPFSLSGWPRDSQPIPIIGDLDNDSFKEIIVNNLSDQIFILRYDGQIDFSINNPDLNLPAYRIPIIGDFNNDGYNELLFASQQQNYSKIYMYNHQGNVVEGWPYITSYNESSFIGGLATIDLDYDNFLEIINTGSEISILNKKAMPLNGWPKYLNVRKPGDIGISDFWVPVPLVGNLDNDPELEIFYATNQQHKITLSAFNLDGSYVNGWPREIDGDLSYSPIMGDINNDGSLEIFVPTSPSMNPKGLYLFDKSGNIINGWPKLLKFKPESNPALADFGGDGNLEIVIANRTDILILNNQGSIISSWSYPTPIFYEGTYNPLPYSLIVGDVNGDNVPEIITTTNSQVYIWNWNGMLLDTKITEMGSAFASIDDIDNDGKAELIAVSLDDSYWDSSKEVKKSKNRFSVYVWDINSTYNPIKIPWPTYHHDNQNTNLYRDCPAGYLNKGCTPSICPLEGGQCFGKYCDNGLLRTFCGKCGYECQKGYSCSSNGECKKTTKTTKKPNMI